MKKLCLILVSCLILAFASVAFGSPFLVCNSYPTTVSQPTDFMVTVDLATPVDSPAQANPDGSVQLHYDLAAVANGAHTVTVTACNQWGCSAASSPFSFAKATSATPAGLSISKQ